MSSNIELTKCSSCGTVAIYEGSRLVTKLSLTASSTRNRVLVTQRALKRFKCLAAVVDGIHIVATVFGVLGLADVPDGARVLTMTALGTRVWDASTGEPITPSWSAPADAYISEGDFSPDGRLVVLEGAGHMAPMERHEQFNDVLREFLSDVLSHAEARP